MAVKHSRAIQNRLNFLNMSKAGIKKKYDIILGRETNVARLVALKAIKPKPFSVWEVLIPILFILGYMRSKEQREIFAQNLLFTKKTALEAAYNIIKKAHSRESEELRIKKKTDELLRALPDNVYSEAIRQEQLNEINLLIDHYCKLLSADGKDYSELITNTYQDREAYEAFQETLKRAENKVTQAARQTLGGNADSAMAERIGKTTDAVRAAEIDKIFRSNT